MNLESISSFGGTIGGGFVGGILIGYALKKIVKLVVIGLFSVSLASLQYQQIIEIKWPKLQAVSQNTLSTLANATTQIPGNHTAALSNLGIPLTGSMSMGSAIGFMKG